MIILSVWIAKRWANGKHAGIETNGVTSRITDEGGPDEIDLRYYAHYRTEDGEEVEGLLSDPRSDLKVGQQVRLKYHPKHKTNARLVG